MAGFLKNRRPFLSGYYLVDNLKRNYEIPSFIIFVPDTELQPLPLTLSDFLLPFVTACGK